MSEAARWVFEVHLAESAPAGTTNEDACGAAAQRLWVLDGATGVSHLRCTRDASDAAWLAATASRWLAQNVAQPCSPMPVTALLNHLESYLTYAFAEETRLAGVSGFADEDTPSSCLGVVQIEADMLRVACVGDISVVILQPDGSVHLFSDQASAPAGSRSLAAWQAARVRGVPDDQLWEQVRPVIFENRALVNRPDGYRVVHPIRPWADGVQVHSLSIQDGTRVLLASDGLWRLIDLFGACDGGGLLAQLGSAGFASVLAQLREFEEADARAMRFPRIKRSDDATAVLATLRRIPDADEQKR